jgi:glutamate-1-semialdehyde aminotransferase
VQAWAWAEPDAPIGDHDLAIGVHLNGARSEQFAAHRPLALIQWADLVRFSVSGTESVQAGLRLARAATGLRKVIRFAGRNRRSVTGSKSAWSVPARQGCASCPLREPGPMRSPRRERRPHREQGRLHLYPT